MTSRVGLDGHLSRRKQLIKEDRQYQRDRVKLAELPTSEVPRYRIDVGAPKRTACHLRANVPWVPVDRSYSAYHSSLDVVPFHSSAGEILTRILGGSEGFEKFDSATVSLSEAYGTHSATTKVPPPAFYPPDDHTLSCDRVLAKFKHIFHVMEVQTPESSFLIRHRFIIRTG